MNHKNVILFVATLICPGFVGIQAQNVKDIDGNVYKTVTIGKQIWMAENLKTTKYNDGKAIPLVTDDKAWGALTTPAYCWYYNNASVSYTHLRAHETVLDLVCRLLLEKKK